MRNKTTATTKAKCSRPPWGGPGCIIGDQPHEWHQDGRGGKWKDRPDLAEPVPVLAAPESPWAKVRRLERELAEAMRAAWASEATGAGITLLSGPPPGMLCGSRLTDNGERCLREAGHVGNHDPFKPEEGEAK